MNNKVYDVLKVIALVVLPALATLIIGVFEIWGLPYGAQIGATITAVATFLGAILSVSSAKYHAENKSSDKELLNAINKKIIKDLENEAPKHKPITTTIKKN
jgi:hypothetical protein